MGGRDADLRGVSFSDTLYVLCADGVCMPGIATLAQSVERLTRNEQVDSSILSSGSIPLGSAPRVLYIQPFRRVARASGEIGRRAGFRFLCL